MQDPITIARHHAYPPAQDFDRLRAEGLQWIQEMASDIWTDYNVHDPGITILEALAFALTDLGYRLEMPVVDLLALPNPSEASNRDQSFFTAAEILTINPLTVLDYRKLLIDLLGVRNAWLHAKTCACEGLVFYAHALESRLSFEPSDRPLWVRGLYDVEVEFDRDQILGDLNSGQFAFPFRFSSSEVHEPPIQAQAELWLPTWRDIEAEGAFYAPLRNPSLRVEQVKLTRIAGNREASDPHDISNQALARALRKSLYLDLSIHYRLEEAGPVQELKLSHCPLKIWFEHADHARKLRVEEMRQRLESTAWESFIQPFHQSLLEADRVMQRLRQRLHAHRNLAEDFCSITAVPVENFAVCADVDLEPEVDIEEWLARAYKEIEDYLNPPIPTHRLEELLDENMPVETLFSGPRLEHGFFKDEELRAAERKTRLQSSDMIHRLMNLDGVRSIRNFTWVRLDAWGNKSDSEPWSMEVSSGHLPRFSWRDARFLVFKDGLPFLPRQQELIDTLRVLRSSEVRPYNPMMDLPVPQGTPIDPGPYIPISSALPPNYGLGPEGLPAHAPEAHQASALQLAGYMQLFEQIFHLWYQQALSLRKLFSSSKSIQQTYFGTLLNAGSLPKIEALLPGGEAAPTPEDWQSLVETRARFLDRRRRFLDHLLSRFGEDVQDYALMLNTYEGSLHNQEKLVEQRIDFLQDLPFLSRNRARALDLTQVDPWPTGDAVSGLERRIQRLLGLASPRSYFELYEEEDEDGKSYEQRWRLRNEEGKILLSASTRYVDDQLGRAQDKAWEEIDQVIEHMINPAHYIIAEKKKWGINLVDGTGEIIATRKERFDTEAEAEMAVEEILEWAQRVYWSDKVLIIEHMLLRPRTGPTSDHPQGDPFLSICYDADDPGCCGSDPYSFRITIALNGSAGLANQGIAFRRYAETCIRREVPAHIGLRICWLSEAQMMSLWPSYQVCIKTLDADRHTELERYEALVRMVAIMGKLKSIYPPASLHDCIEGNDEHRVYLNQTII